MERTFEVQVPKIFSMMVLDSELAEYQIPSIDYRPQKDVRKDLFLSLCYAC